MHATLPPKTSRPLSAQALAPSALSAEKANLFILACMTMGQDLTKLDAGFHIDDQFRTQWDNLKFSLGRDEQAQELAKAQARTLGCSAYFTRAMDSILKLDIDDIATSGFFKFWEIRFSIALRLAIHLSNDKGAAIFKAYDELLANSVPSHHFSDAYKYLRKMTHARQD